MSSLARSKSRKKHSKAAKKGDDDLLLVLGDFFVTLLWACVSSTFAEVRIMVLCGWLCALRRGACVSRAVLLWCRLWWWRVCRRACCCCPATAGGAASTASSAQLADARHLVAAAPRPPRRCQRSAG